MEHHQETVRHLRRAYFVVIATGFATIAISVLAGMTAEVLTAPAEYRHLNSQIELLASAQDPLFDDDSVDTLLATSQVSTRYGDRRDTWYRLQLPWRHQQLRDISLDMTGPQILPFYSDITYERELSDCVGWRDLSRTGYGAFPIDSFPQRMLCHWVGEDAILYWPIATLAVTQVLVRHGNGIEAIDVLPRFDSVYVPSIGLGYTHDCTGHVPLLFATTPFDNRLRSYPAPYGCHWLSQDTLLLTINDSINVRNNEGVLWLASGRTIDVMYAYRPTHDQCPASAETQRWLHLAETPWLGKLVQSLDDSRTPCAWITDDWFVSANGAGYEVPREIEALLDTIAGMTFEDAFPALHQVAIQNSESSVLDSVDLMEVSTRVESRAIPNLLEDAKMYGIPLRLSILEVFLAPWVAIVHVFFLIHLSHTSHATLAGHPWIGSYAGIVTRVMFAASIFVGPVAILALDWVGVLDSHGMVLGAIIVIGVVQIVTLGFYWSKSASGESEEAV